LEKGPIQVQLVHPVAAVLAWFWLVGGDLYDYNKSAYGDVGVNHEEGNTPAYGSVSAVWRPIV
jgi:hypothetical protein